MQQMRERSAGLIDGAVTPQVVVKAAERKKKAILKSCSVAFTENGTEKTWIFFQLQKASQTMN